MPRRPTRSEEESYRVMFFIVSSLIMASMVWLVYQEFFTRRPWKNHQLSFFRIERMRAEMNLASEQTFLAEGVLTVKDEDGEEEEIKVAERVAALEKTISELEGNIVKSDKRIKLQKLEADLAREEQAVKDQEMVVAFAKAAEDEFYYYYRDAKHHDHMAAERVFKNRVDELHATVTEESHKYDEAVAVRDRVLDEIGKIKNELLAAKKSLTDLRAGVEKAKRAIDANDKRFLNVDQYWNQEIDLVDRCHTCHMGVAKCGFSSPEEILNDVMAKRLNAADVQKKYCTTREEAARYVEVAEEVRDSWGEEDELQYANVKDKLGVAQEPILKMAEDLGYSKKNAEKVFRSHPYRSELLAKHPGQDFGCTTCHYGQGRQLKGVGLNYLKADFAKFTHARSDHYWLSQLLDPEKNHTEASCFNCHKQDYELEYAPNFTSARKLATHLGCTGCHPLGPLDSPRKHGPSLEKVAGKINTGWLIEWIKYPKALRPRTRMPHFFSEATNEYAPGEFRVKCNDFDYAKGGPPSPSVWVDCEDKRDREVAYMARYILGVSTTDAYPEMPATADKARGEEVFNTVGCIGCHNLGDWDGASTLPGSESRDIAPNLSDVSSKIKRPGWIYAWVRDPKSYWHETRMPRLRLSDQEAWDVTAFLMSQTSKRYAVPPAIKAFMDEEGAAEKGKKLINWYGCFGCHDIKGFEKSTRIGVELTDFGSKAPHKLDFGDVPEFVSDPHAQGWEPWTRTKLQDPRIYRYERVETRMPQFDLSPREVDLLVLFLKSQNAETSGYPQDVQKQHSREEAAVQRGAFLVDAYNCRGCHRIDDTGLDVDGDRVPDGGRIYAWFEKHPDEKFRAPPKLIDQGAKTYPDWLFEFLKDPYTLRENYKVRMPTFQFTDEVAGDFVAYFSAKAGVAYPYVEKKRDQLSAAEAAESRALFEAAQCLKCHSLGGADLNRDPKNVAPSLLLTAERLRYEWLFDWLKDPQKLAPGVGMPGFYYPDDDNPGEYVTPLPKFANGNWRRQLELLRAFVIKQGAAKSELAVAPSN